MNEKTCTLEKEMRQALLKKLEQNYLDYTALLQALTPEQLMDRTQEVYAAQVCYSLPSTYGWKTWAMHDVSVAAYRAGQKQYMESEDRLQKLLEHLDGKEITSAGHLSARNFTFGDEIIEMDGNEALKRICPRIDLNAIQNLLENTSVLEPVQKEFYLTMLTERKEKILDYSLELLMRQEQQLGFGQMNM